MPSLPTLRNRRSYRSHLYTTRASQLTHTPGSRNTDNPVRVIGLARLADPARFETMGGLPRNSIMPDQTRVQAAGGGSDRGRAG